MRIREILMESDQILNWWYNPGTGKVVDGEDHHAFVVFNNPDLFGITKKEANKQYKIDQSEGDVDTETWIHMAMDRGWVRIGEPGHLAKGISYVNASAGEAVWHAIKWLDKRGTVGTQCQIGITGGESGFLILPDHLVKPFLKVGPKKAEAFLIRNQGVVESIRGARSYTEELIDALS